MDLTVLWAVIIAFALTAAMGPFVIPYLRKLKVGQTVRDDGPESHLKKNGTPTMGGIMIVGGIEPLRRRQTHIIGYLDIIHSVNSDCYDLFMF